MIITAKYPGRCYVCGGPVRQGDRVEWDRSTRKIRHPNCAAPSKEAEQAAEKAALDMAVEQFTRIFRMRVLAQEYERGQRSGRVDPIRAGRILSGCQRIFEQAQPTPIDGGVAGSLAIVTSLQDLDSYHSKNTGADLWADAVRTMYRCAESVHLPVRLFASNRSAFGDSVDLRQYATADELLKDRGVNSWTRQREAVEAAEKWHREVNGAGKKLTVLITRWPEMRNYSDNTNHERYLKMLEETGQHTAGWTRYSRFFAVGIMLEETCKDTWGEYKSYGVHNHFRECFPSATRIVVDDPDDVAGAIRELAVRTANA